MSDVKAGLLALLVVAVATYMGFAKRVPWADDWEIRAVVAAAPELHASSPVRIAGVDVGRVTRVERGPGTTAVVTMAIEERGRPLHRDATLKVRPRIFLEGNFFVDLRPGTPRAPELREGDTIPLGSTAVPVQFDEVLSALDAPSRTALQDVLREYGAALGGGGAEALRRSFPDWAPAFRSGARTAEALRGPRADDLPAFLAAQARVSGALAADELALGDLVTDLRRTVGALADRDDELGRTVDGLARTARTAHPALGRLNAALPELRALTADLRPALRRAPRTLDLAQPVLREADGLLRDEELGGLVRDLRPALRALVRLEPRLEGLLRRVTPVTDCVRERAVPVLRAELEDGHLSTGRPVWQEFASATVGLAGASQNFDGNGPAVRYLAGYGDQLFSTGAVPGAGRLVGAAPEPLLGSRPARAGATHVPPFRPDVPCRGQRPPDLRARTTPPPAARRTAVRPPAPEVRRALRDLRRRLVREARP